MEETAVRPFEAPILWRMIERFLETKMSESLYSEVGLSLVEYLDAMKIESIIFERAPFLCLDKAVILENRGAKMIVSRSVVTPEMCEGHFPGRMMIPLQIFAKIMALTGEILTAWVKNKLKVVPMALRATEVRTTSNNLVSPPSSVITGAQFLRERMPFCWVSASAWVGNENVARIKELVYYLMPAEEFFSGVQLKSLQ